MDKPTTPGGGDPSGFSWPEDPGSEQGFGATGIFGTLQAEEPKPKPLSIPMQPPVRIPLQPFEIAAPEPPAAPTLPKIQPPVVVPVMQEPVVHKVVLGSGTGEHPAELLDRIRMASAERSALADKPQAPQVGAPGGGQGSGGFTELLRTLSGDAAAPAAKPAVVLAPPSGGQPAPMSGFTSLLQTLNAQSPVAPVQKTSTPAPLDLPVISAAPPRVPPPAPVPASPASGPTNQAPAPGGFTELLRMSDFAAPQTSASQTSAPQAPGFGELAKSPAPWAGESRAVESKAGAFTQLFGTFSAADAGVPAMPGVPAAPGFGQSEPDSFAPGSFTRMLSLEQQSAPPSPAYREEPVVLPGSVDYGRTPGMATPVAETQNRDPFAADPFAQTLAPAPVESAPAAGGMGITRLIQMLDEPSALPAVPSTPMAEPSASMPPKGGPGIWTQTFEALNKGGAPAASAAAPPPSAPSYPAPMGGFTPAAPPPAQAAGQGLGPSEFTRIMDASRMREMAMRGGGVAESQAPAAGAPRAGGMAPPSFAPPAAPAMPAMPAMGGMPHPGGFAPPPPPAVAVPSAPPAKPAPPAGKLQQLVPLLLVITIVLLVVLIVTVIFLMKH